jgi:hypothetical protein
MTLLPLIICAYLSCVLLSLADTTVYLDRPFDMIWGYTLSAPYFNPKIVTAPVGEKIHFVARFQDITKDIASTPYPVRPFVSVLTLMENQTFVPYQWGFAESDYSSPCIYNKGQRPFPADD